MTVHEPESRPSPDTKSAGALVLDFPASMFIRHLAVIKRLVYGIPKYTQTVQDSQLSLRMVRVFMPTKLLPGKSLV
jgi:hypothetical protein